MSVAYLPIPSYLTLELITPYISQQINIGSGDGQISTDQLNTQIALAEADVELDLSTWFAVPFANVAGGDWTTLSAASYNYLFKLFLAKSLYNIYREFYGITGDNKGDDFWTSQLSTYNEMLKRLFKLDQTQNYLYQTFPDLVANPIGMKRILAPSKTGLLGGVSTCNAQFAIKKSNKPRWNW